MNDRFREALMAVRATELGRMRNHCSGWISVGPLPIGGCIGADIASGLLTTKSRL